MQVLVVMMETGRGRQAPAGNGAAEQENYIAPLRRTAYGSKRPPGGTTIALAMAMVSSLDATAKSVPIGRKAEKAPPAKADGA